MAGYKRPAERFAARVAKTLFQPAKGQVTVRLEPWFLDREFRRILTQRYYQITLVGLEELGLEKPRDEYRTAYNRDQFEDAEIGAGLWMKHVLDGPRQVHSSQSVHEAHNVLLSLCKQGHGWPDVAMDRAMSQPLPDDQVPKVAQPSKAALARIKTQKGNPEGTLKARREAGPLWIRIGMGSCEVIDALSLWDAMRAAPGICDEFSGDDADNLVHLFARAFNVANRHWDALRLLGLSPPAWIDDEAKEEGRGLATLSVSQALAALALVKEAKSLAETAGRQTPTVDDFRQAWENRPILKRMSFDDFLTSTTGQAIVSNGKKNGVVRLDADDPRILGVAEDTDEVALASHTDVMDKLADIKTSGDFDDVDLLLLFAVAEGKNLQHLYENDASIRIKYPRLEDLSAALDDLQDRVIAAVS